ncbi:MAG TPA: proteasome activator [Acidimicrobiales bacterium]
MTATRTTNAQVAATDHLVVPTKAIRVLGALRRGLVELEHVDLDDAGRRRVAAAQRAALIEAASAVSEALLGEMVALHVEPPSPAATLDELRVGQAQLLGWLNGLVLAEATVDGPVAIGQVLLVGELPEGMTL